MQKKLSLVQKCEIEKTGGEPEEEVCRDEVIDKFWTKLSHVEIHDTHDSDALWKEMLSPTPENLDTIY